MNSLSYIKEIKMKKTTVEDVEKVKLSPGLVMRAVKEAAEKVALDSMLNQFLTIPYVAMTLSLHPDILGGGWIFW